MRMRQETEGGGIEPTRKEVGLTRRMWEGPTARVAAWVESIRQVGGSAGGRAGGTALTNKGSPPILHCCMLDLPKTYRFFMWQGRRQRKRCRRRRGRRHLELGGEGGLHNGQGGREQLVEHGVLLEEVAAEQVLAGRRVHQQLVHAPEYDLHPPHGGPFLQPPDPPPAWPPSPSPSSPRRQAWDGGSTASEKWKQV